MSRPHNIPKKHHYIPVFYLKRWADKNGLICEFSRPYKTVVGKTKHPAATGYFNRLYELRGLPPSLAQQVETKFFQPWDNSANDSMNKFYSHANAASWNDESRTAWTRFILSLLMRCPEDVAALRNFWPSILTDTTPEQEIEYSKSRKPNDPSSFSQWLRNLPPQEFERQQFRMFLGLVDHDRVGERINNMHWICINLPEHARPFLTSDRPIILPISLSEKDGFIGLPIGPHHFFVSANHHRTIDRFSRIDPRMLSAWCNTNVVEAAEKFAYGTDDKQLRFVQNRLGKTPQPRLLERALVRNLHRSQARRNSSPQPGKNF